MNKIDTEELINNIVEQQFEIEKELSDMLSLLLDSDIKLSTSKLLLLENALYNFFQNSKNNANLVANLYEEYYKPKIAISKEKVKKWYNILLMSVFRSYKAYLTYIPALNIIDGNEWKKFNQRIIIEIKNCNSFIKKRIEETNTDLTKMITENMEFDFANYIIKNYLENYELDLIYLEDLDENIKLMISEILQDDLQTSEKDIAKLITMARETISLQLELNYLKLILTTNLDEI